ncbi:hypothetical protein PLICRDRAFT_181024 [Plicaturopsis crispa FD-325 SS-3]|uniref:Uncharacterized protein n=1 Tax=Plicaturopsis crispa FD-325 SS-3 TaxID=944288 RepID=A0A0C9SV48_PLICR|nr:hypothetical protein PLICRDRAFT_181024 [Plicaturopsis crispa FD-325 SS-3]
MCGGHGALVYALHPFPAPHIPPSPAQLPHPTLQNLESGGPSNHAPTLDVRARETITTRRDASRRLVVVTPPAGPAFLHPRHTTTALASRAGCEAVNARRQRHNEEASRCCFPAAASFLHLRHTPTALASCAGCEP